MMSGKIKKMSIKGRKLALSLYFMIACGLQNTMAKVCAITKKGSIVGGGYSNRTRATQFNPTGMVRKYANLQKKRI